MVKVFPIQLEMKAHITDGDGVSGSISYAFPLHHLPTEADLAAAMESVAKAIPPDFRLMSRHESTMHFLREEKGYRGPNLALSAMPAGEEWHDPASADTWARDAGDLGNDEDDD